MNFRFRYTYLRSLIISCLLLGLCAGCSRSTNPTDELNYRDEEVLGKSGQRNVVTETWYMKGIMGLPVRRVCLKQRVTNSEVLFIVEKEFQESVPGYPMLVSTNGLQLIQDETHSYVFSLADRRFITNYWTNLVYMGDYRPPRE